jgi:hypothetical protein
MVGDTAGWGLGFRLWLGRFLMSSGGVNVGQVAFSSQRLLIAALHCLTIVLAWQEIRMYGFMTLHRLACQVQL